MIALEVYLIGKGKRTACTIYLPTTDKVIEEDMRAPMILPGDFNAQNPLWGSENMSKRERMLTKIQDRYQFLCINKKETIYYRAFDGRRNNCQPDDSPRT